MLSNANVPVRMSHHCRLVVADTPAVERDIRVMRPVWIWAVIGLERLIAKFANVLMLRLTFC